MTYHNWQDFDILEQAVLAVIAAKPHSPVALLTDGSVRLTVFAPTDQAFRDLVGDLTGRRPGTEKKTVKALLKFADIDTIETVLLYHVVPGATLASPKVIKAAKAHTKLKTAQGGSVKVVNRKGNITLVDKDPTSRTRPSSLTVSTSIAATSRSRTRSIECCSRSTSEADPPGALSEPTSL